MYKKPDGITEIINKQQKCCQIRNLHQFAVKLQHSQRREFNKLSSPNYSKCWFVFLRSQTKLRKATVASTANAEADCLVWRTSAPMWLWGGWSDTTESSKNGAITMSCINLSVECLLLHAFSSMVRVKIRVRLSVWLVSDYARVFVVLDVVTVTFVWCVFWEVGIKPRNGKRRYRSAVDRLSRWLCWCRSLCLWWLLAVLEDVDVFLPSPLPISSVVPCTHAHTHTHTHTHAHAHTHTPQWLAVSLCG